MRLLMLILLLGCEEQKPAQPPRPFMDPNECTEVLDDEIIIDVSDRSNADRVR